MKAFSHNRSIEFLTALTCGLIVCLGLASISNAQSGRDSSAGMPEDGVKIEPYKGPPILLDEPEQVAVQTKIVNTQTIPEKLGDGKVEREVARYSDNSFAANGFYRE